MPAALSSLLPNLHAGVWERTSVHVSIELLAVPIADQPASLAVCCEQHWDLLAQQARLVELTPCRRSGWKRSYVVNPTRHPPSSSCCRPPARDPVAQARLTCAWLWVGSRPGCTVCQHPRMAVGFLLLLRSPRSARARASTLDWLTVRAVKVMGGHWLPVGAVS
jgi:hypothetical protein